METNLVLCGEPTRLCVVEPLGYDKSLGVSVCLGLELRRYCVCADEMSYLIRTARSPLVIISSTFYSWCTLVQGLPFIRSLSSRKPNQDIVTTPTLIDLRTNLR